MLPASDSIDLYSESIADPIVHGQAIESAPGSFGAVAPDLRALYLERVSGSRTFVRAAQLRRLLNFLGTRTMSGEANPPTEYDVALEVLHRGSGFDPRNDSLVRKEMSRLRAKLAEYYAEEGSRDPVVIHCSGAYRLDFKWRSRSAQEGSCCLLVLPAAASEGERDFADLFYDELMLHLSSLTRWSLVSRTSARYYATQARDIREICTQCGADAVVEIDLKRAHGETVLLLWLIDGSTGLIRSTVTLSGDGREELIRQAAGWLLRSSGVRNPAIV